MAFFKKVKEAECTCMCKTPEVEIAPSCCGEKVDGICCIKVLGAGCKNCHTLYENAQQAVKAAGIDVEVEYITDMQKIMEYGVMSMPALVINEQVTSMGKVLKADEILKLLRK